MFDLIAFDADDTLWENNLYYLQVRDRFRDILAHYSVDDSFPDLLDVTESRNLKYYGYGVMSFTLSLIEAAISITGGRISAMDINTMIGMSKGMIDADVEVFEHAAASLQVLSKRYRMILITKGELSHQQSKIARSGLGQYFEDVYILPDKTRDNYAGILKKRGIPPSRFLMVGDSMRSDILPVLDLGGWAVYVPNNNTWTHEKRETPQAYPSRFFEVEHLGKVPSLLERIERG